MSEVTIPVDEKKPLVRPNGASQGEAKKQFNPAMFLLLLCPVIVGFFIGPALLGAPEYADYMPAWLPIPTPAEGIVKCPLQPPVLDVGADWLTAEDEAFRKVAYERLKGAVQIKTQSHDDMPMDAADQRWDVFYDFEKYLQAQFPRFHKALRFERVNTHGLLYTWEGSNKELKPIILMAHQDVVPVNPATWSQWTHPPFSGHLDEEGWVWGRGTTDMKGTLIALMGSAEKLLEEGFKPERTIIYSMGFDEEIGGPRGAAHLAKVLTDRYGSDGVSFIFDEGFTGVDLDHGTQFARLGLAEKGCLTLKMHVHTPGGHSSNPPPHTGVGIMSEIIVAMENNPSDLKLREGNPLLGYLECLAEYGQVEAGFKRDVRDPRRWSALVKRLEKQKAMKPFLGTTQAVDIFHGGTKFNALPEVVDSTTNYRIDFFETSQTIIDRLTALITPIAAKHNLTFSVLDSHPGVENNVIKLEKWGITIEPAPLTPDHGSVFNLVGGTVKKQFGEKVIIAPSAMVAFTDTQYYWDLSRHIYRFVAAPMEQIKNFHTVDERIHFDAHLSTIRFFYKFLQNTQGWRDDEGK